MLETTINSVLTTVAILSGFAILLKDLILYLAVSPARIIMYILGCKTIEKSP